MGAGANCVTDPLDAVGHGGQDAGYSSEEAGTTTELTLARFQQPVIAAYVALGACSIQPLRI